MEKLIIPPIIDRGDVSEAIEPLMEFGARTYPDKPDFIHDQWVGRDVIELYDEHLLPSTTNPDKFAYIRLMHRFGVELAKLIGPGEAPDDRALIRTKPTPPGDPMFYKMPWHTDITTHIYEPTRSRAITQFFGSWFVHGTLPGWTAEDVHNAVRESFMRVHTDWHARLQDDVQDALDAGDLTRELTQPNHLIEYTQENIHAPGGKILILPSSCAALYCFIIIRKDRRLHFDFGVAAGWQ